MKIARFYFPLIFVFLAVLLFHGSVFSQERRSKWTYNELAVDLPFEGGAMLMYSRMKRLNRVFDIGFFAGGGQINRKFDLSVNMPDDVEVETEALVLPFFGPQLSLNFNFIGVSLGYGAFWARTEIEMNSSTLGRFTGETSGWGSGFYSPLLVLDFYNRKHDMVFGFGLGGLFGTSYRNLLARSSTGEIQTDASPIQTLTFHLRMLWADGRKERLRRAGNESNF